MSLKIFARSIDNDLGIGKILSLNETEATVEYFHSIGRRECRVIERSSLRRVTLSPRTRCYLYLAENDTWLIGRIAEWDEEKGQYYIDLPDKKTLAATVERIYVRSDRPSEDPIEILALKGQETPYYHSRRSPLVRSLLRQRAASRGMTGLLSANIALYPHQVEVARRVLEDPIQRYLLADEVGLGKTIEAGIILRQFLLDEPEGRGLILVPAHLVHQWKRELEEKFYLSRSRDRVTVRAIGETLPKADGYGILIVDEAHRIAPMARADRRGFDAIRRLAREIDRVLLLSATPILHRERDFLILLHLLDPDTYRMEDIEGFRHRIAKRQEIGRVLLACNEQSPPFILKKQLARLRELFPEDDYLAALIEKLQGNLADREALQHLRGYVSETYRLHRRMLRNRRDAVEDVIFDRNAIPRLEYDLDERIDALDESIDEWRVRAPDSEDYRRVFRVLRAAANTWLGLLQEALETRLQGRENSSLSIPDSGVLVAVPKFAGEEEILQGIITLISRPSENGDRLELLKMLLLYHSCDNLNLQLFRNDLSRLAERIRQRIQHPSAGDRLPKIIIFTSFTETATAIVHRLIQVFGSDAVTIHRAGEKRETIEKNIDRFTDDPKCFLLVADASGEEGRNLQFVDGVIHFDIPLSPNSLEQRLGRIDRIGGKQKIPSWLFIGSDREDSLTYAWYRLLHEGFGIFENSIAGLQFYADDKLPELEKIFFESGASRIIEEIARVQEEIEVEKVKISEQNALDEIDSRSTNTANYFEELEECDDAHEAIERSVEKWILDVLNFEKRYSTKLTHARSYRPTTRTLIPVRELQTYFAGKTDGPGIYDRRLANRYSGVKLYRVGEELIDSIAAYLQWDDRGKAFAMWRQESSRTEEWIGFRFDYKVQIDLEKIQKVLETFPDAKWNRAALQRRGDALFPPFLETIFLDLSFRPVGEENLLTLLQRPYRGKGGGERDYNLAKERLPILDRFIDRQRWPSLCFEAREASEKLLRDRERFREYCQHHAGIGRETLDTRLHQLQRRQHLFGTATGTEELAIERALQEAFLEAIHSPMIRLDAVGFIILSDRSPVEEME
jgi:ATP-dependent helicase HepA